MGIALPILPGQGIGPIRFGATKQTIERLMGAPVTTLPRPCAATSPAP